VLLPWADGVAAVVLAWFPGQEFGHALADVLLGTAEPGGRLPTTWPATEDGLPSTQPRDGVLPYDEGLAVGYRDPDRDARYPFGHGLGYTTWEYRSISAPDHVAPGQDVEVAVTLANTGDRAGREVVQIYAARPDGVVERPPRWLAGFATVDAEPGEEVTVRATVRARALEHWDGGWTAEPGRFRLGAGPSSAAQPVTTSVEVRG
jgi:beta-glucosidase